MIKKAIVFAVSVALLSAPLAGAAPTGPSRGEIAASNQLAEKDAMKLLVMGLMLDARYPGLMAPKAPTPQKLESEKKAENARSAYWVGGGITALITWHFARAAKETVLQSANSAYQSVVKPFAQFIVGVSKIVADTGKLASQASANFAEASSKTSSQVSETLHLWQGIQWASARVSQTAEVSSKISDNGLNWLVQTQSAKWSSERIANVPAGAYYASGMFAGLGALTWSGVKMYDLYTSRKGVTKRDVINLIGEDKELMARVDQAVRDMGEIYAIPAARQADFKAAIFNALVKKAIETRMSRNATVELDLVEIAFTSHVIDAGRAEIARTLQQVVHSATRRARNTQATDLAYLRSNVAATVAFAQVLEEMIRSDKMSDTDQKEASYLLENVNRNLALIKANLN